MVAVRTLRVFLRLTLPLAVLRLGFGIRLLILLRGQQCDDGVDNLQDFCSALALQRFPYQVHDLIPQVDPNKVSHPSQIGFRRYLKLRLLE
ncbi:hypothetical protein D3C80_1984130 [compost metagenome]